MKAVIDEDLHRSIGKTLSELGFKILDVRDHGLRSHPDQEIFMFAQNRKAILFPSDLGFSNTLRFPLGSHRGVVILRFPNELSTTLINKQIKKLLEKLIRSDYAGNLIIISPGKLRIRRYRKH